LLDQNKAGAGAAVESIGFRLGMLISGAGALYLASFLSWQGAYSCMALVEVVGIPALWLIPVRKSVSHYHSESSVKEILSRSFSLLHKQTPLVYLVAFVFLFKVCDTVLNAMSAPFLFSIGFDKIEYASISKSFGITLMVMGGLAAGYLIHQLGSIFVVVASLFLEAVCCFLFVIQLMVGHDTSVLMITIGVESFVSGMASAAFIALITRYCQVPFSASHFTFLYAMGSLSRVVVSMLAGVGADVFGWNGLFFISAFTTIPAFWLLIQLIRHYDAYNNTSSSSVDEIPFTTIKAKQV
jgi:PAT family beta-lactamase induction signal transducer AmpG